MSYNDIIVKTVNDGLTQGYHQNNAFDQELMQLYSRQESLKNQQETFIKKLGRVMDHAAKAEKGSNYQNQREKIMSYLELGAHLTAKELFNKTKIPEDQLIVILANLMQENLIAYDKRMRYYKR